jgi:CRISPR-associated endonuclease/helicase Cas3
MLGFCDDPLYQDAVRYHDLGKCSDSFQSYIRGEAKSAKPHAPVSALAYFVSASAPLKKRLFVANAIASHHRPIQSPKKLLETYLNQRGALWSETERLYEELLSSEDVRRRWDLKPLEKEELELLADEGMWLEFGIGDYIDQKLLYSHLIYADKYEAIFGDAPARRPFEYSLEELEAYERKMGFDPKSERSRFAREVVEGYLARPGEPIYTITAPTGIGKTLASLRLALTIAQNEAKERIIYAIPFTSIIDQTAALFDRVFAAGVTRHHYRVRYDEDEESHNDYDRVKFLATSWSEPFIVSTFYQLFFALLGAANSDNIKLQSLQRSVVVLDEVQGIPFELWKGLQELFGELSRRLGATFVLMSATMPIVTKSAVELAPKKRLFAAQDRYEMKCIGLGDEPMEALAERIRQAAEDGRSVLCVLNTIKNSKLLYMALRPYIEELYCLNSYILPRDRARTIEVLREPGSNQVVGKVLISTQVVEAGVDLDFDVGFREMAPLSSLIQTAGRVNREGRKPKATLYLFDTLGPKIYDSVLMKATEELLRGRGISEREILELSEEYFGRLDLRLGDRYAIAEGMEQLEFEKVDEGVSRAFGLEGDFTKSVVLGVDMRELERKYFDFCAQHDDPWARKSYKERLYGELVDSIVSIKEKDLERSGVRFERSELFGLYYLDEAGGVYSPETGFLIREEMDGGDLFEI